MSIESNEQDERPLPLGKVVATPGAMQTLEAAGVAPEQLLQRHQSGDWGDVDTGDRAANRQALLVRERLLSAYILPTTGACVWIITEADRSVTTLLLPEEY